MQLNGGLVARDVRSNIFNTQRIGLDRDYLCMKVCRVQGEVFNIRPRAEKQLSGAHALVDDVGDFPIPFAGDVQSSSEAGLVVELHEESIYCRAHLGAGQVIV
jgi:hypothetical protein